MKKIYALIWNLHSLRMNFCTRVFSCFFVGMLLHNPFYAQQTYMFTNCNGTGNIGATQGQTHIAYVSKNLSKYADRVFSHGQSPQPADTGIVS